MASTVSPSISRTTTTLAAVRARAAREAAGVPAAHGLAVSWASSEGGAFNFDFNVSFTEAQQRTGDVEYNYARRSRDGRGSAAGRGRAVRRDLRTDAATYARDRPGMSAFVREDGVVYHTYSTYARGLDAWGMYARLDRAPLGRNETGVWWRRHDEYARD
jgi:predicted dithiol-disulfide oxidoreductase (DUF899 family)